MTVLAATVLVASGVALRWQVHGLSARLGGAEEAALRLAEARGVAEELAVRRSRIKSRQEVLGRLVQRRGWDEVIAEVAEAAGDGIWFESLSIEAGPASDQVIRHPPTLREDGATLASESGADGSGTDRAVLTLWGYAVSNAEFATLQSRLNRARGLIDAEPVTVRAGELLGGTLIEFSVTCRVRDAERRRDVAAKRRKGRMGRRARAHGDSRASQTDGIRC